ncbi:sensor histidine kinase [Cohnella faecalis]|uniref:histidine kinase n=1 Tax=Cohnella faecalis TaxID=2315694 RepID=A0A398D2E5_9BACL|nr:HAMP domain-containing sensor histidine kinase [Cohnella faecalis]RIE05244.1 sensor histidine kinase [Cohnella faecalis]
MKKLRIRTFSLLSLLLILLLPWIFLLTSRLIGAGTLNFEDGKPNAYQMIAGMTGLMLAFFIVGFEMRRFLLNPLEKLGLAARRISAGDRDIRLPKSGIAEIAEVSDAFNLMVDGLREANLKQRASEEERRFVIAAIAHDLRTPLFSLRGYLDGLEQGIAQSPEKMAKYVAVCKEKSAQLDRLVEDLFTIAKLDYAENELNDRSFDFKLVLSEAIETLRPTARQKQVSIIANLPTQDCFVNGDSHLLERAIENLLDNAVRHAPNQGKILVQCRQDGPVVTFAVQDSGPGFNDEELQRAFDPLYRGEQSRNRSTGGAGLGLTISQRIIRRHGGELTIANHPDGGALLSGRLPMTLSSATTSNDSYG